MGPQSILVLVTLILSFAGLAYVQLRHPRTQIRVTASVLSFAVAAVFGIACVNRYYMYYTRWGDLWDDLTGKQVAALRLPPSPQPSGTIAVKGAPDMARKGLIATVSLAGPRSHIKRDALVYLPPEYFQPRYVSTRFPVLELLHGSPGTPADWIRILRIDSVFQRLLAKRRVRPFILVMPTINGAISLSPGSQCLDAEGEMDDTYLSADVPALVSRDFRAYPIGRHWAVGGFSEGGFCAANLALRHPTSYAAAAILSGYFHPLDNRGVRPFAHDPRLLAANDPIDLAEHATLTSELPTFFLLAGASDHADVTAAQQFQALLQTKTTIPLEKIANTRHSFAAWTNGIPDMLDFVSSAIAPIN